MSNTWGKHIKLSIFGESHGEGIGIIIDGLPPGFKIDMGYVEEKMAKRAPGGHFSTKRKEADKVEIISGFFNEKTTGTPLCGIIRNTDIRSGDYEPELPRPGTADYSGYVKYKGFGDYRGGGHFSGRITAPLNFAGTIARQYLMEEGIDIGAHMLSIGKVSGKSFLDIAEFSAEFDREIRPEQELLLGRALIKRLGEMDFPVLDEALEPKMKAKIEKAQKEGDSVGGIIECVATGLPAGLGSPFFNSLESSLASMIFSIPATKGIEFGRGFAMAEMKGSMANDQLYIKDGKVIGKTNESGGINGGISNGMPLVFRTVIRPTPSIYGKQETVNLKTGENSGIQIKGRHDPCIVPRAVVVVESAMALCLMDALLESRCFR